MAEESKDPKDIKKHDVRVSRRGENWEVSTEGDSAVLFTSAEKEAALDFAKSMAETHKVKVVIEGDEKKQEVKEESSIEKPPKPADILVVNFREEWVVRNENDSAVLFSSAEKEAAVAFATQMSKEHGVHVKIQ